MYVYVYMIFMYIHTYSYTYIWGADVDSARAGVTGLKSQKEKSGGDVRCKRM